MIDSFGGLYGATHLPIALSEKATGIPSFCHLPTNGGGPAITALLGNNAQVSAQSTLGDSPAHQERQVARAGSRLAAKRSKVLLYVPYALKELGLQRRRLSLGRPIRAQGNAGARSSPRSVQRLIKAVGLRSVQERRQRPWPGVSPILNAADFAKFWAADAKRSDEAVQLIGKQG